MHRRKQPRFHGGYIVVRRGSLEPVFQWVTTSFDKAFEAAQSVSSGIVVQKRFIEEKLGYTLQLKEI